MDKRTITIPAELVEATVKPLRQMERFSGLSDAEIVEAVLSAGVNKVYVPAGQYEAVLTSLEMVPNAANTPVMAVSFKIASGEYAGHTVTMKKVLHGTRNDANKISNAKRFLQSLDSGVCVSFRDYSDFRCVMADVTTMTRGRRFIVDYDPEGFTPIHIRGREA